MKKEEILKEVLALAERDFDINECFKVLTHNTPIYWSWGVEERLGVQNKCLLIKVNGYHHKGWVGITLGWMDTFDVHIISLGGEILETIKDVYVFDLVKVIDERIEKVPAYQR